MQNVNISTGLKKRKVQIDTHLLRLSDEKYYFVLVYLFSIYA